jgi:hypothetical protein
MGDERQGGFKSVPRNGNFIAGTEEIPNLFLELRTLQRRLKEWGSVADFLAPAG